MWRQRGDTARVTPLEVGTCITIPVGTQFQFKSSGGESLSIIGVTMGPWPGVDEAYEVEGNWTPNL